MTIAALRAANQYSDLGHASRAAAASPHELVVILFEEALKAMDVALVAASRGDPVRETNARQRASAIVLGLETSLDFARGGTLAVSLAAVYREVRRQLGPNGDPVAARALLTDIFGAWGAIGLTR